MAVPRLNKCISCQEKKGTKPAVLSGVAKGVAKLRSVVATATPGHPLALPLVEALNDNNACTMFQMVWQV